MSRPIWFVSFLKRLFPQRYFYAKLTRLPLIGKLVDFFFFRGDQIVYLPQDHLVPVGVDLEVPADIVLPSQIVDHFIEQARYHWIMDACICREGDDCQDYPHELGCIFLGESVLKINPALGRLVSKDEALAHARRCREAGLIHMIGRNRLDSVWLGVNPSEKLMTICNCCPCCCLWKMVPDINPEIGGKIARMPGVTLRVTERCIGCGDCAGEICFMNAISMNGHDAQISDACRGCGRCVELCPHGAIELTIEGDHFMQQTIDSLSKLVDIS